MMNNNYEARISIPAELAPALWKLVGGEDVYSLNKGIIAACSKVAGDTTGQTIHGCPVV